MLVSVLCFIAFAILPGQTNAGFSCSFAFCIFCFTASSSNAAASRAVSYTHLDVYKRQREGNDLYNEMKESGVINKTALVYGQMNEPPGARMRVALSGLTMAEYFRDKQHQDVLLFIDNIFRFTQAGSCLLYTSV